MVLALVRFGGRAKGDHMSDDDCIFYTIEELSKRWKKSERTIRRYCQDKLLIAYFIGGTWRIDAMCAREYEERVCNTK